MRRRDSSGNLADKYGKGRFKRGTRCRSVVIGLIMIISGSLLGGCHGTLFGSVGSCTMLA